MVCGDAEGAQILHHRAQLVQALVEDGVAAPVDLQGGQDFLVLAGDGDELQNFIRRSLGHAALDEQGADLFRADLIQLVHRPHDLAGLLGQALHGVEAGEDLPVVHADLEPLQAQGGEGLVDDGGDLGLVGDVELAVADHVDVTLIKLAEPAPLGALAAVDFADLIAAEGEGQVGVVQGDVLGQGDRQVKAQGQVAVALGEAVDLLLRLAVALGQQDLGRLDDGGVEGGEAVQAVRSAELFQHPLKLRLRGRQQFHKTG